MEPCHYEYLDVADISSRCLKQVHLLEQVIVLNDLRAPHPELEEGFENYTILVLEHCCLAQSCSVFELH
jgi:hypothetical protein